MNIYKVINSDSQKNAPVKKSGTIISRLFPVSSSKKSSAGTATRAWQGAQTGSGRANGGYEKKLAELYDKFADRDDFKYDAGSDPMYEAYKDKYERAGRRAMDDTLAGATELTGGYLNSYAVTAGQGAYDKYMAELADVIPDLEESAYERRRDELDELIDEFNLAGKLDKIEYDRYMSGF